MLATLNSSALRGIDAELITVEVDVASSGLPSVIMVGMPDTAVKESRDRVRTAITNSGYSFPDKRITINLAPAELKKEGPAYDLPIALGVLAGDSQIHLLNTNELLILGELSLEGEVRKVRGILAATDMAKRIGLKGVIVPSANAAEAAEVQGIDVFPVNTLEEAVGIISGALAPKSFQKIEIAENKLAQPSPDTDFKEVRGQDHAKRALAIAAAGSHNCLMIGPPGTGKSMLAKALHTILPKMTQAESIETTKIYSAAGALGKDESLISARPFRSPHHTISYVGLTGGGSTIAPGEVSLAHNGVLFMDELPEYDRKAKESLRQPLEDNEIVITRASGTVVFPSKIMLVAAMNPSPMGHGVKGDGGAAATPAEMARYWQKVSGPLLDRLDIHIEMPAVKHADLQGEPNGVDSATIRETVTSARDRQIHRFTGTDTASNATMSTIQIRKHCKLDDNTENILKQAMDELELSARAYHKILKVARTIADFDNEENISFVHISEAIQYRSLDRMNYF